MTFIKILDEALGSLVTIAAYDAIAIEKEKANAWKAAHDVVKEELERTRAELMEMQAHTGRLEHLLARRHVGHAKHGEGAVADGPGAPGYPDVRGLVEDIAHLIDNAARCSSCGRVVGLGVQRCAACIIGRVG